MREPADIAARSGLLTRRIAERLKHHPVLTTLDVATGTGANLRYLAEYLPASQDWLLVDSDPRLLAALPARMHPWAATRGIEITNLTDGLHLRGPRLSCRVRTQCLDLSSSLEDRGTTLFAGRAFVTASALLDLVSEPWLQRLAERCRKVEATALFALTYDGRIQCSPDEPEDGRVRSLVNTHQRTNKGFGAALGPDASSAAERAFAAVGYHIERQASDWVLDPETRDLQRPLLEGWADAASAVAPAQAASIRAWRERRLAHVNAGRSQLIVGHEDMAAWLP
jgi:hypothetical protein